MCIQLTRRSRPHILQQLHIPPQPSLIGERAANTILYCPVFRVYPPWQLATFLLKGLSGSEAQEDVEATTTVDALAIGFNVNYLLDALSALRDEFVVLQLRDANSSALVRGADHQYARHVVMPLRL